MAELMNFIQRAVKSQFSGKIELNFSKGNFKINVLHAGLEANELIGIAI